MNPPRPPDACGSVVAKFERSQRSSKAETRNDQNQNDFEAGEYELEVGRLLDAEIVEPGNKPGDRDSEKLRPERAEQGRGMGSLSQWKAGKKPSVRASPMVTAAMEAGLATANQVHI